MKNTLNEEKLKEKFTEDDKNLIERMSKEGLDWLESNINASPEEIEAKQKELESKFNPIMMRVYGAEGAGGMPGGIPGRGPGAYGYSSAGSSAPPTSGVDDLD